MHITPKRAAQLVRAVHANCSYAWHETTNSPIHGLTHCTTWYGRRGRYDLWFDPESPRVMQIIKFGSLALGVKSASYKVDHSGSIKP